VAAAVPARTPSEVGRSIATLNLRGADGFALRISVEIGLFPRPGVQKNGKFAARLAEVAQMYGPPSECKGKVYG
jgi:hypothetical protein